MARLRVGSHGGGRRRPCFWVEKLSARQKCISGSLCLLQGGYNWSARLKKKNNKNGGRGKEEGAALFADGQTGEANVWRDRCKYADKGREKTQDVFLQVFLDQINPKKRIFFPCQPKLKIVSSRRQVPPRNLASASVFLRAFFGAWGGSSRKSRRDLRGVLLRAEPPSRTRRR